MNSKSIKAFVVGAFAFGATAIAQAQQGGSTAQSVDVGKYEYDTHLSLRRGVYVGSKSE
jgi:hypothetical protein